KLWPAVFLTGIPGDMGGGVVMNAGIGEMIKPREFCEIVEWVEVMRPIAGAALPNLDVSGAESSAQIECESRTPPTKTNASVGAPVPAKTAPNIERIPATQINRAYRHSSGWQPGVIIRVAVGWSLEPDQEV